MYYFGICFLGIGGSGFFFCKKKLSKVISVKIRNTNAINTLI